MNPNIQSLNESFAPTTTSEPVALIGPGVAPAPATRPSGTVHYIVPRPQEESIPAGFSTIDEVVAGFERDPALQDELLDARRWIADTLLAGKQVTMRTLRLRKGLSQAQLAQAIGTQQPHVARIERGQADPQLDTCRRIARALGVDLNALDQALQSAGRR